MERLSVVIANYNYEAYVSEAIESALAMRWDDLEVVVVDDGSTDGSVPIIEGYADRVKIALGDNATQRVAANRGFAMTTGDVVIFLDSDDILPPDLPMSVASRWYPGVSKFQFQMQRIDAVGVPVGAVFPAHRRLPSPREIRNWALKTSAYPTPPGSANAYARSFLERIFPLDPSIGDFADSACLAAAPFLGDVVCVPDVVVGYRQHGANDSDLLKDAIRFPREVARARARWRFSQSLAGAASEQIDERPLFRSRELLQLRVASHRVAPLERPLPRDTWLRMAFDSVSSPFHAGPESASKRLIIAGWCAAMLLVPDRLVRRLLTIRYGRAW